MGHFPARVKNVIWCFMDGGPSHIDLFDPKPAGSAGAPNSLNNDPVQKISAYAAALGLTPRLRFG